MSVEKRNDMKKHVLVTGANGFIGTVLCRQLKNNGFLVRRCVRKDDQALDNNTVAVGNIDGKTDWNLALEGAEIVVHLATAHHLNDDSSSQSLKKFQQVNIDGTLNLAYQADQSGISRFIYLSSIKVNGEETFRVPFKSEDVPAPVDYYGKSKLEAEKGLFDFSKNSDMEIVVIRPPLVFGRSAQGNFLKLIKLVKAGIPLPFGMVRNKRSIVYVENLCELIQVCFKHPQANGRIFLVTEDSDVSTPELISLIAGYSGTPCRLFRFPLSLLLFAGKILGKSNQVKRLLSSLQVDDSETRKILGWSPSIKLEDGIKRSVS